MATTTTTAGLRILEPGCAWTRRDVADEETWTERLDAGEQAEVDAALRHALAIKGDDVLQIGEADFTHRRGHWSATARRAACA